MGGTNSWRLAPQKGVAMTIRKTAAALLAMVLVSMSSAALALGNGFGPWTSAVRVEPATGSHPDFNGSSLDGCPFISRDGKMFFMASDRPGGVGGIDIWLSTRAGEGDPWGQPVNVGAPVNTPANDFCPTIARNGHDFYFVSNRAGGCGGDDIYATRLRDDSGFEPVVNLGCEVNSAGNEASPFPLPEAVNGPVLYFSSTRSGNGDLYVSASQGGTFVAPTLVAGANSATAVDGQPNVRRDGLELFFFSNREGNNDIYSASRAATSDPWSTPVNLGPLVNSAAAETRPSLSWDGTTLYFGSTRPGGEGSSDHYQTTREDLPG